jgi:hypothetical protein
MPRRTGLPKATASESAAFLFDVFLPTVAKGPIIRRPKIEAGAKRLGLDDRAVCRLAATLLPIMREEAGQLLQGITLLQPRTVAGR